MLCTDTLSVFFWGGCLVSPKHSAQTINFHIFELFNKLKDFDPECVII